MTSQDPYGQAGWQGGPQPGWQGNPQPGWQDPYAQPGYGGYGGYGPPGGPPRTSNGAAIGALVANIIAAVFCCAGIAWLPGVILSAIAIGRTQQDPESARSLTVWAWVCLAIDVILSVALVVVLYLTGEFQTRNV